MKGTKVIPSAGFRRQFPKRAYVTSGEIVGLSSTEGCFSVKWAELARPETIHRKFLTFVESVDGSQIEEPMGDEVSPHDGGQHDTD